jgi:ubiquitin-protein ligase
VSIYTTLIDTPGPCLNGHHVSVQYTHKLKIIITEDYPYQTPIVRWRSNIFHPNIMNPLDGGYVCTRLLDEWKFGSTLFSFIKGLETLLANPNPKNPYDTDICTQAAEYFNKNQFTFHDKGIIKRNKIKISEA